MAPAADDLLSPKEAARYLHVQRRTLDTWRYRKSYPLPYIPIGSKIFYKLADVLAFIESRRVVPGKKEVKRRRTGK
jgi:hypothetical protein